MAPITHRYRMKALYQRNMLLAQVCAIVLVGTLLGIVLWMSGPEDELLNVMSVTEIPVSVRDSSVVVVDSSHPARSLLPRLNPYVQLHDGFLGFRDLRPQPNVPVQIVTPQPLITVDDDLAETSETDLVSFSLEEGIDTGVFLPESYVVGVSTRQPIPPVNQEITVVRRVDPEYPLVALDSRKEGEVTVIVHIDSTGLLTTFPDWVQGEQIQTVEFTVDGNTQRFNYAAHEEPSGWYFAEHLLKVLPKWQFVPRIVDGAPVSALLRIRYRYCLNDGCRQYDIEVITS